MLADRQAEFFLSRKIIIKKGGEIDLAVSVVNIKAKIN
jgi:hypothetical protein